MFYKHQLVQTPQQLVLDKMQYLETIADATFEILKEKFQYVFDQLEPENKQHQAVKGRFVSYLQEHIVIGFNSSPYDIPLVKAHLLEYLLDKIKFVILKGKSFTCLTATKLKFLGIKNYTAPGFDYAKFIRAYEVEQQKFYWPYEWFQNFQQLDEATLPPHAAFCSSLKKENTSQEAYALCQTVWKDKNWTSMLDHHEYYNNLDVEPFLQAGEKLFNANKELGLDAFKSSLTLPGLTLQLMFSDLPPGVFFTLINQSNSDLHQLIKKNVCAGLSVVFHREY